jgi:hypothetical protein
VSDPAPDEIPGEAISAAADALAARAGRKPANPWREIQEDAARAAVEAAAPHIRAAERERIRHAAQERFDALGEGDFSQAAQAVADILLITLDGTDG